MSYADYLRKVSEKNLVKTMDKDAEYGGSWLKRGGVGAFMNLARKWDRIELQASKEKIGDGQVCQKWDIIEHALCDQRDEGIMDDLGDLVGYLLLIQAEVKSEIARIAQESVPIQEEPILLRNPSEPDYHDLSEL